MYPSSTLCRTQEKHQRDRAANAELDHIRVIASRAADAWGREALLAERREQRQQWKVSVPKTILPGLQEVDRWTSENPDRAFPHD